MAKWKQGNLFEEDEELIALKEKERKLAEKQKAVSMLPVKLEREKREREATMPPMQEIAERARINQFERNLTRGQVANLLRTQRHSVMLMFLLLVAAALMLAWAYRVIMPA